MKTSHLGALALAVGALLLPSSALAAPPQPTSPTVATGPAKSVTFSGATLTGTVNPRGSETDYYFQYGTTKGYGAQTPLTPIGNGTKNVTASTAVSGLGPNTLYHYRLVAVGASRQDGGDKTFTTLKVPLSVAINASPNPVTFGNPFVINGTLSGTGSGNQAIQLQATPFPYTAPFANVGNAEVTHPDGSFSFTFAGLLQTAKLRVVTTGKPVVTSAEVIENVAVHVVLHVQRVKRAGFVRLTGTVTPPEVGAQVVLQRLTRTGPQAVGHTTVKGGTSTVARFTGLVRKRKHSLYRAAVIFTPGMFSPGVSLPVLVR
jgi:hypothetical protein